jgi:hypothetical protein
MGMEYVPAGRQNGFIDHLLDNYVAPGGRLIFGPTTEERNSREMERRFCAWGHEPTGYCEKSHQTYTNLARKLFWFDKA